jgi:hypothetical protein
MNTWGKFRSDDGIEYDLSHLDPFVLSVTPKAVGARTYYVAVSFWHHTFAREVRVGDAVEQIISRDGDDRCFCVQRYEHSRRLPELIRNAAGGKVYFGEEKPGRATNYLLIDKLPGLNGPYVVFFNMVKSKLKNIDTAMLVTSAYEKPGLTPNIEKITFATLVATVARGQKPTRPAKRW